MKYLLVSLLSVVSFVRTTHAQKEVKGKEYHYLVLFEDKGLRYTHMKDSSEFLSVEAIERRRRFGISMDSLDLPVTKAYIKNIQEEGIRIRYATKWLNGAVVTVKNPDDARRLRIKFFVRKVTLLGLTPVVYRASEKPRVVASEPDIRMESIRFERKDYGKSYEQIAMINAHTLHKEGYRGRGVHVAVFDAGFKKYNALSAFKHLKYENRLQGVFDIVDQDNRVDDADAHGMHVLGCISGFDPGTYIGTAPEASISLFRTESSEYEYLIEELNWIRAAEMADSMGVDIINSSLGYTTFDDPFMDHTHAELDGVTTFIAQGAKIAASRGILIVNSAGNDGNKPWKRLDSPADAEDILTVGAVDFERKRTSFSSVGPTSDGRIKPDVAALGHQTALVSTYGGSYTGNGTSYSTPIISGAMACLMQKYPNTSPTLLRAALRFGSSKQGRPDTLIGYGIPNFVNAELALGKGVSAQFKMISKDFSSSTNDFQSIDFTTSDTISLYLYAFEKRAFILPYKKVLDAGEFSKMGNLRRYFWEIPEGKKNKVYVRISTSADFKNSKRKLLLARTVTR